MSSKKSEESATEKGDATSKYTTNHEPSKTVNETTTNNDYDNTTFRETAKTGLKSEGELPVPDVPDDILEIIDSVKEHKDKIKRFLKDDKLLIENLVVFKDKLDDITGTEMDSFVEYVSTCHIRKKDKFCLSWNELWKILVFDWPIWENQNRNEEKIDEWMIQDDGYDGNDVFD